MFALNNVLSLVRSSVNSSKFRGHYRSSVRCSGRRSEPLQSASPEMTGRVPYSPGTINPALLTRPSPDAGADIFAASPPTGKCTAPAATRTRANAARPAPSRARRLPRLPRISSDCDLEDEILAFLRASTKDLDRARREFDSLPGAHDPRVDRRIAVYRRYFKSQTEGAHRLHIPGDPLTSEDAEVVVDNESYTIYDAYLLSADVTRNLNSFQRHRVWPPFPPRRHVVKPV